jgi:hypothetical protein
MLKRVLWMTAIILKSILETSMYIVVAYVIYKLLIW